MEKSLIARDVDATISAAIESAVGMVMRGEHPNVKEALREALQNMELVRIH